MAPILFDAATAKAKRQFSFTFGRSRETSRWTDKRSFEFNELAAFLNHPPLVGQKDGECYTPAMFSGYRRDLQQTTQIDVVVLDSDCGHSFEYIKAAVNAKGWRAIIHSTYSHLSQQTEIAASAFRKWEAENKGKGAGASVGQYMMEKKGFLPEVMATAFIADEISVGSGGSSSNLIVRHSPCPKLRILLPLECPWLAETYESQDLANAKWRERIGALAFALGLYHDQSCVDTSRLFYFPRVKDEAAQYDYTCDVLDGEDCDLWSLPDAEVRPAGMSVGGMASLFENSYNNARNNVISLTPRASLLPTQVDKKTHVDADTGEIFDLTTWAARYAARFEIVKALRAKAPHMLAPRKAGVKQHIYCARAGDHLTGGLEGTGTYCVNASDLPKANLPSIGSGFVIHCMHNGCAGVDRLEHIRSLLEQKNLSVDDLTNIEFLANDVVAKQAAAIDISKIEAKVASKIDSGGIGNRINNKVNEESQTDKERDSSNISEYLYKDLPGALGAMHHWIVSTAKKPQPVLALATALTFCASAIGQRVQLQKYGLRSNIYILGVGVSGSGKDWPMKACKRMAKAAGLYDELIGVEEVASDSGIVSAVSAAPRQLILIDEVSFLLNAVNDQRSGAYLKNVIGTLLKLYSNTDDDYKSKSYADTTQIKVINQPCVSFYGATTPRALGEALTSKDVESGLLSRMMIFDAGLNDPRINHDLVEKKDVPEEIIEWLTAWNSVKPIQNIMATFGGDPVISPRIVMITDEAQDIIKNFEGEMHDAKGKARLINKDALYVRAAENALKFALIRACAIWPVANEAGNGMMVDESALKVDAQTMRWAVDLSRATVARMVETTNDIADTPYEQTLKALRKAVQRAGVKGMTSRDLARTPAGRMPAKALAEHLGTLHDANEVRMIRIPSSGRGRPRDAYIHKNFFHIYKIEELMEEDEVEGDKMAGE